MPSQAKYLAALHNISSTSTDLPSNLSPLVIPCQQQTRIDRVQTRGGCLIFPQCGGYMYLSMDSSLLFSPNKVLPLHLHIHSDVFHGIMQLQVPWDLVRYDIEDFLYPTSTSHIRFSGLFLIYFHGVTITRTEPPPSGTCPQE